MYFPPNGVVLQWLFWNIYWGLWTFSSVHSQSVLISIHSSIKPPTYSFLSYLCTSYHACNLRLLFTPTSPSLWRYAHARVYRHDVTGRGETSSREWGNLPQGVEKHPRHKPNIAAAQIAILLNCLSLRIAFH